MDLELKGKTALITGGGSGIGAGIGRVLASEGCNIIVSDISSQAANDTAKNIEEKYGVKAIAITVDVTDKEQIIKGFDEAFKIFDKVDILVNNAAVAGIMMPFLEITDEKWQKCMVGTNDTVFYHSRAFAKHAVDKGHEAYIVNISSKSALMTSSKNCSPYVTSKSGVIGLTRSMAKDLIPYGIRVNCIAPGYVKTEKNYPDGDERTESIRKRLPTGEFASPEDIGRVAAFLCSPYSSQMIGTVVDVTGGTLI